MELTPFAQALAEPVRSVLRQIEDVSRLREGFDPARMTRSCVIAARDLTISLFGPLLLARFAREAPEASFRLVPWESDRLGEQLASGAWDLAIGVDPPAEELGLRVQKLYEDDYVAVCSRASAPEGGLGLEELARRPALVVTRTDRVRNPVDRALVALGREPRRVAMRSAYFLAALSVVGDSDLLMVVPRRLARKHAPHFGLAVLEVPLELPRFGVFRVGHERFANSALHQWLRRAAVQAVRESAP